MLLNENFVCFVFVAVYGADARTHARRDAMHRVSTTTNAQQMPNKCRRLHTYARKFSCVWK